GSNPGFETIQKAISPKLEECALCVFMFHSKIGKFTEEEFKLASELNKKIIPFFKKGFSPGTDKAIAEWRRLVKFKKSMNETILYQEYKGIKDLELLLTQNLNLYLSEKFSLSPSYENKPLSPDVSTLIHLLNDKEEEIKQLKKSKRSLPDAKIKKQLALLEKERDDLRNELQQNKEIQEQQAKEKQELELRLAPQVARDNLKQKALTAIKENNYVEAEVLLKESAKDTISETASTFYELGKLKKIQLLYKEALYYFELAVKINPDDFDMNMEAGSILCDSGYNDKAIIHFENALQILKPGNSKDESNLSYLYNELGCAYNNKGEYDKAIEYYTKALNIDKKIHAEEHPDIAPRYSNIGLAYNFKGEYDKAIEYYTQALTIAKKFYGEAHADIATYYNNFGSTYHSKGEYNKALDYYTKALAIDKKLYGEEHPNIGIRYNNISYVYYGKGEYDKAIEYYQKALPIFIKFLGENHPSTITVKRNLEGARNALANFKK
ncbi:MAG TPA: tetratricopeptide repeat protein, partial [Bacteroidia bacterium]|nr:tetratricopeptide repeat protein [Bacteroidia bacterium]